MACSGNTLEKTDCNEWEECNPEQTACLPSPGRCNTKNDCSSGKICNNHTCVKPLGTSCYSTDLCQENLVCTNIPMISKNICSLSGLDNDTNAEACDKNKGFWKQLSSNQFACYQRCEIDSDCSISGQKCHQQLDGPNICYDQCNTSDECLLGSICNNKNTCITCGDGVGCESGSFCNLTREKPECQKEILCKEQGCPAGMTCSENICTFIETTNPLECNQNTIFMEKNCFPKTCEACPDNCHPEVFACMPADSPPFQHSCFLKNGTLYCQGDNQFGQIGERTDRCITHCPVQKVSNFKSITELATGDTCIIEAGPKVLCWGDHSHGQLGNGENIGNYQNTPSEVIFQLRDGRAVTPTEISNLVASLHHTCAIVVAKNTPNNGTYCWGDNTHHQVAPDHTRAVTVAQPALDYSASLSQLYIAPRYTCGYTANKYIHCWGEPTETIRFISKGSQGINLMIDQDDLQNTSKIATGDQYICGIDESDSIVYGMGDHSDGKLGSLHTENTDHFLAKKSVMELGNEISVTAQKIAAGTDFTCIETLNKEIKCWGNNRD